MIALAVARDGVVVLVVVGILLIMAAALGDRGWPLIVGACLVIVLWATGVLGPVA